MLNSSIGIFVEFRASVIFDFEEADLIVQQVDKGISVCLCISGPIIIHVIIIGDVEPDRLAMQQRTYSGKHPEKTDVQRASCHKLNGLVNLAPK